jgi:ABC-type taurine transport system ATPase subunit
MRELFKELSKPDISLILVIGGADTGKTTLVEILAGFLSRGQWPAWSTLISGNHTWGRRQLLRGGS